MKSVVVKIMPFLLSSLAFAQFNNIAVNTSDPLSLEQEQTNVYFIGHLNPDSDSIFSAIAAAHLLGGIPARTGAINGESQFILEKFKLASPVLVEDYQGKKFHLVDFNQKTQLPDGIAPEQIVGIIDHHAVQSAFVNPSHATDTLIKPWGSTCTLVTALYLHNNVFFPQSIAGGLLGGIVSDTLNLSSPTTTAADRKAVQILAKIAGIEDVDAFAKEMLEAKSNISHLNASEILKQDFKVFEVDGTQFGIAVVETLFLNPIQQRQDEILKAMNEMKSKMKLRYLFLAVVQPQTTESYILIPGEEEEIIVSTAFAGNVVDHRLKTSPMVSRKLQFLPAIQKVITKKIS